jgi:hypothetical protein
MKIRYSALLKGIPPVEVTTKPAHYERLLRRYKRTSWEAEFERLETEEKPDLKAEKVKVEVGS